METVDKIERILSDVYESINTVIRHKLVIDINDVYDMIDIITEKFRLISNEFLRFKEINNKKADIILSANRERIANLKKCFKNMIEQNKHLYIYTKVEDEITKHNNRVINRLLNMKNNINNNNNNNNNDFNNNNNKQNNNNNKTNANKQNNDNNININKVEDNDEIMRDETSLHFDEKDLEIINNIINEDNNDNKVIVNNNNINIINRDTTNDYRYFRDNFILKTEDFDLMKESINYLKLNVGLDNYIVFEVKENNNKTIYYSLIFKKERFRLKKFISEINDDTMLYKSVEDKYDYLLEKGGNIINI